LLGIFWIDIMMTRFHDSNKHPRSFGIILKTCLYFGIQPVFIPIAEPWGNGCT